jgi:hypothetical protein
MKATWVYSYRHPAFAALRIVLWGPLVYEAAHATDFEMGLVFAVTAGIMLVLVEAVWTGLILAFGWLWSRGGEARGVVGEHRYRISPEGLRKESAASRNLYEWTFVGRPRRWGRYIYVPIRFKGSHIVPIRHLAGGGKSLLGAIDVARNTYAKTRS